MKNKLLLMLLVFITTGCSDVTKDVVNEAKEKENVKTEEVAQTEDANENDKIEIKEEEKGNEVSLEKDDNTDNTVTTLSIDSCDNGGQRKANAIVDIGYDSDYATRDYYAYTNKYGQLVKVEADEIILQDDNKENGGDDRYCNDEAKVPGVESSDLDEGHAIADSLGGVSNAYNITPQESQLNRYGAQADMEQNIRNAGGAKDFEYIIEYDDNDTQIPSSYSVSYVINGKAYTDSYSNDYNEESKENETVETKEIKEIPTSTNDNKVTYANCTAVRDAGAAPIHSGDPGYSSKLDRDGDGVACE